MKLRLLPSAFLRSAPGAIAPTAQPLTTFIVHGANGAGPLAIDAGSLGLVGEADQMTEVREVLLTHAHIDHVATLPMWAEALLALDRAPVVVHATVAVIQSLRAHLFNDVLFPDFERLRMDDGRPLLEYRVVPEDEPFTLAGFEIRAFRTDHPVPTHGYLVDDGTDAVLFGADGGPSDALWRLARGAERLRAVVLEASFPNRMAKIARGSGHLTPALLCSEAARAPEGVRVLVTHLKPAYREEVARALLTDDGPPVELVQPGVEIEL